MADDSVLKERADAAKTGRGTGGGTEEKDAQQEGEKGLNDQTGADGGDNEEAAPGSGNPSTDDVELLRQLTLVSAIKKLERMCVVLGIAYKNKLLEMGVTSDHDLELASVMEQIRYLEKTVDTNYKKLKEIGKELLIEWDLSGTPFKKMVKFAHVVSVVDSLSSSAVRDADVLSTKAVQRARREVDGLRTERLNKIKKEFEKAKDKLKVIVEESHITWESVGYDLKKKVNPKEYIQETAVVMERIRKAEDLASGRTEMVFRVQYVRKLIAENKLPLSIMRDFLNRAKEYVNSKEEEIMYDGVSVSSLLESLDSAIDELEDQEEKQLQKNLRMQRIRTRYGSTPSESSDDEADS